MRLAAFLAAAMLAVTATAGTLPILKYRAQDDEGDALSGALLYFYEAGTTTPLDTYSDEALSSANANPVVASSTGWFGEIYLKTDEAYKVVLKTSGGTTIWTVDDVYASQLVSDSFQTRIQQAATNPLDYGAVGDGVADEYSYVQDAIDAATGVVDLLGKTYRCDSMITLKSGIVLKNGTLDFTQSADNAYIYGVATEFADPLLLSGNATRGDLDISMASVAGLAADDWIRVYSTATLDGTYKLGELAQIDSIAGTTVTLKAPLDASYATANSASVQEMTPISRVRIQNVTVLMATAAAGTGLGVYLNGCEDITIDNSTFEGIKLSAISTTWCAGLTVRNSVFEQSAASAAAVNLDASQNVKIEGNSFRRIQGAAVSAALGHYQTRDVWVVNNSMVGVTEGVLVERGTERVHILNNTIIGDTSGAAGAGDGIECHGIGCEIRGNKMWEMGGYGISHNPSSITFTSGQPWITVIDDNYIADVDNDCINATDIGGGSISRNTCIDPGENGIVLADSDNVVIAGNQIDEVDTALQYGISLATSGGDEISGCTVTGNTIRRADDLAPCIDGAGAGASDLLYLTITGNVLENGTYGIELTNNAAASTFIANNVYASMATGEINGSASKGVHLEAAANTACTTTCGDYTCFAGYDDGVPAVVVCTDASADRCVCFP